jgi:DNA topoisomerase VI subunit B
MSSDFIRPKSETVGTYYERLGANANTTPCFALSEFIDNSIEAYERANNGSCDGCKITVRFITEQKNNGSLIELQNIRITDNGCGIKKSKIQDAISKFEGHDYNNVKSSIEKGNFGIGLKFGSFALGNGFSINTKAEGEEEL